MKFDNLLRYAVRILSAYSGESPLQAWLKNFYRENPQMGSRDRKQVSEMVYCFFRLGHSLKNISAEERILAGLFLSNSNKEQLLEHLRPEWHVRMEMPMEEKLKIVRSAFPDFDILEIFPWTNQLSAGMDHRAFCLSFLVKPKLFIRVRPGFEKAVPQKLLDHSIDFQDADPGFRLPFRTFSLNGGTKLDNLFLLNREAVIQDLSSQGTAIFLKLQGENESEAWDCCAGSGGKSILLADLFPGCQLTVSDIRETILKNLSARFKEAGLQPLRIIKADLTDANDLPGQSFRFIVADLPCTGSGTWSRTPEALYFFNPQSISNYRQRQEKILSNITAHLNPGAVLVYITCSVFSDENERISGFLTESGLKLEKQGLIGGYESCADSMYAARFTKRLTRAY
jgi:16S rRNA (cytosine967-C5)-methyltransferase